MKSTIVTLIMLMCCFTIVKAQEGVITEEEINEALFEEFGINFNGSSSSNSNSNSNEEETDNQIYVATEKMAEFPGGIDAQLDFINRNLVYPPECISNNIEGRILLEIIIEKDGRISSAKVWENSRDKHPALIREALRLVSIMPKWTPAEYRGNSSKLRSVRYKTSFPILFRLRDGKYLPFVRSHNSSNPNSSTQKKVLYRPTSFISTKTFEEQILPNMNKAIVLSFYADYAAPCKTLNKDWDTLFETFKGKYRLYHVDVVNHDESSGLVDRFHISVVPALILIYNRNGDFVGWRGWASQYESGIKKWFEDGIRKAESYFGR